MAIDSVAESLRATGFRGALHRDRARRVTAGTDNSIYQEPPDLVAEPAELFDLDRVMAVLARAEAGDVALRPRGGGTATNGQSLGAGLALDCSARLTAVEAIDAEAGTATVQPGVVLDQLNAAAAPYGLHLGASVSTASRATLGGMIATNAAGAGSCVYGDTSDRVVALELLFADGTQVWSRPLDADEAAAAAQRADAYGRLVAAARDIVQRHGEAIAQRWPATVRRLTGYDLFRCGDGQGGVDINRLIAGSEGSLAVIRRAVLRLAPLPAVRGLVVLGYRRFADALADAETLRGHRPSEVETFDATTGGLALREPAWRELGAAVTGTEDAPQAANFVGFSDAGGADPAAAASGLAGAVARGQTRAVGAREIPQAADRAALWGVRGRAVGLLGSVAGRRKPVPFMEDAAVPPDKLASFVTGVRAVLDTAGLSYGMFGHVDAGCIHVRPALDLTDGRDRAWLRPLTDRVHRLALEHGGILWGEHGKGYRSEYIRAVYGEELYAGLAQLKAAADPANRLNPGKLVAPDGDLRRIAKLDGAGLRGHRDAQVPALAARDYAGALACNGNGVCFHWDARERICPSFKATRDRLHSPKGRATALRDWLAAAGERGLEPGQAPPDERGADVRARQEQAYEALDGCLGCKACTSHCPVEVDIPELKARFLHTHHQSYRRPAGDYLVAAAEAGAPPLGRVPALANGLRAAAQPATRAAGLTGLPRWARPGLEPRLRARGLRPQGPEALATAVERAGMQPDEGAILVPDGFTAAFDPAPLAAAADCLRAAGLHVFVASYATWGKGLHAKGFLDAFGRVAARQSARLARLAATGLPLVAVEASCALLTRQEYPRYARRAGGPQPPPVYLVDELLAAHRDGLARHAVPSERVYGLGVHCSEATADSGAGARWRGIFAAAGRHLTVEPVGCCGLAGSYGHERRHVESSRYLHALSWAEPAARYGPDGWLATGFSCRCQGAALDGFRPAHPAEALASALGAG